MTTFFSAVNYAFLQKNSIVVLHVRLVRHISRSVSVSNFTDFFKNHHNSIKLCRNKLKKMPRLNNDERNQAVGMLNAGMSATVVSQHFGCTLKTIKHLRRQFRVTGNVADGPRSGRPCVTMAANDCYIVLQHLLNRRLIAAADTQYDIHPQTVRNRLRQNVRLHF